VFDFHILLLII